MYTRTQCGVGYRLLDIVHADQKLYLVFEFLDVDLKRYMEHANTSGTPISIDISKVRCVLLTCAVLATRDRYATKTPRSSLCGFLGWLD